MFSRTGRVKENPSPPHWRLVRILKRLRLDYREHNKGTVNFYVSVPQFGFIFRFNAIVSAEHFPGWDVIDVDLDELAVNDQEFGETLMWSLISKGYMAYLRDFGSSNLFRTLLIKHDWATKIIDKRLELWKEEPRHRFQIERNKMFRGASVNYVLMHHPTFFDYLV